MSTKFKNFIIIKILIFQAFASLLIYKSNTELFNKIFIFNQNKYLIVPNLNILSDLKSFENAFCGGLFFTFTIGLASLILIIFGYFLAKNFKCFKIVIKNQIHFHIMSTILIISAVLILLQVQINSKFFTNIRDILLLSNSIGISINNFYYKYTLYPAEFFKSLEQKQLKICILDIDTLDKALIDKITYKLIESDYLIIKQEVKNPDLKIISKNNELCFQKNSEKNGKIIFCAKINEFLENPKNILKNFSKQTDSLGWLRKITLIALIFNVFALPYFGFYFFVKFFLAYPKRLKVLIVIVLALISILTKLYKHDNKQSISTKLNQILVLSQNINNDNYKKLINLAYDENFMVSYKSIDALGKLLEKNQNNMTNKDCIDKLLKIIQESNHWYVQFYAYNTLKKLGWINKITN